MKKSTVIQLDYFVHCSGWKSGGYENRSFFPNKKAAREWLNENNNCSLINMEEISLEQFLSDYIPEL